MKFIFFLLSVEGIKASWAMRTADEIQDRTGEDKKVITIKENCDNIYLCVSRSARVTSKQLCDL